MFIELRHPPQLPTPLIRAERQRKREGKGKGKMLISAEKYTSGSDYISPCSQFRFCDHGHSFE